MDSSSNSCAKETFKNNNEMNLLTNFCTTAEELVFVNRHFI